MSRRKKIGGIDIKYLKHIDAKGKNIWEIREYQVNKLLQDMYDRRVVCDKNGKEIRYNSGIGTAEGWYLYNLTKANKFKEVLEVGMAYGTSGLYICQAFKENKKGKLTSIDPFQSTQWDGIGVLNLRREGLSKFHKLEESFSYLAMPELIKKKKKFDMVFIDGMHLFDYTLMDIFYAFHLVGIGGVIVIDDIRHAGVKKAIAHILKNYDFLQYLPDTAVAETMATFVKIKEDDRKWNFHRDF